MIWIVGSFLTYCSFVLFILLLLAAIAIVRAKDYVTAVVSLSMFSLLSALTYLVLGAPDVSITEAAINACLSCVILLCAGYLIKSDFANYGPKKKDWLLIFSMALAFSSICAMSSHLPEIGIRDSAVAKSAPLYMLETARIMQFPNVVTAILASFRGYDTLWETVVIFVASVAVVGILRGGNASKG